MRVLLINPWPGEVFPPPSIGYLQAALKHWGVDVVAKDLNEAMADNSEYDLVGVSFHSFSVKYARQIRDKFKCKLICGGHHPSALPDQMLSIGYDQVVVGEGENAIISIANGNKARILRAESVEHFYFDEINDFPIPDYTGLKFGGEMGIPVISSRGCCFSCHFCASSNFWHHRIKSRSAQNVLYEIEHWIKEGFKTWMFESDTFTQDRKIALEICSNLSGEYAWQCASRAESLDTELCYELYRAGCRTVWLGIESLSQDSLDRCNKHTTVEKMITGIKTAEKAGINTRCQFIVGLPGDTLEDITITSQLIKKHNIKHQGSNIAWVLPGTRIHEEALSRGFKDEQYLDAGAPFFDYEYPLATLQKWATMI